MFRMLDKDGSGKLDSAEFATFLSTPLIARCASVCMCVCVCVWCASSGCDMCACGLRRTPVGLGGSLGGWMVVQQLVVSALGSSTLRKL